MFENPSLVPTVLDALRAGDYGTLLETLDLDEREDFVMAVPPGLGLVPTTITLVRYGSSQAILCLNGEDSAVNLTWHAHESETDAVECHEWKATALRHQAAEMHAAAHGPSGDAFRALMTLNRSGALDELKEHFRRATNPGGM